MKLEFLTGKHVVELSVREPDYVFIIFELGEREPALYAKVGSCSYADARRVHHEAIAGEVASYGAVVEIVGKHVQEARVDDSTLVLEFEDGSSLSCPPDDHFESWEVIGGSPQSLVVCTPGGGIAVVDDRRPSWTYDPSTGQLTQNED